MKKMLKLMAILLALALLFAPVTQLVLAEETTSEETSAEQEEATAEEETAAEGEEEAEGEDTEAEETEDPEKAAEEELANLVDLSGEAAEGNFTNMQAWTLSPSNWNMHTYRNADDSDFFAYLSTGLFEFHYAKDENGETRWTSGYEVFPMMAAKLPEDVTAEYAGKEEWAIPEGATEGYAYKFTLRDDLKWEDGTPINADTYVYSIKELINPKMQNFRADMMWAGAQVMHNAENYFKQGQNAPMSIGQYAAMKGFDSVDAFLEDNGDMPAMVNWNYSFGEMYKDGEWVAEGFEDAVVDTGMSLKDMRQLFIDKVAGEWGETEEKALEFFNGECSVSYDYPEMDFSEVGFFKTGDLEFVTVLDKPLKGFDLFWNLDYSIVYEPYYEASKKESEDSDLITTEYCTKVENTMSYGPFRLVAFQDDKMFDLVRNENWFGWNVPELTEENPQTRIYAQIVKAKSTMYQMFLKGQLNTYALEPDQVDEYRGSDYIFYTPADYTALLNIQSQMEPLKGRETPGFNKTILTIKEFRQALTWSIDRADYAAVVTSGSQAGYGLLNPMYIADPETMSPYRDFDAAKETLCKTYGVEYGEGKEYADLEEAYGALTGYDLDGAKELFNTAYDKAIEAGLMKEDDKVKLTFSFGEDNESSQRIYNYLNENWKKAVVGTKLEGKLIIDYDPTAGQKFGENFRNGLSDLLIAGWSGARMDPFYLISAYLDESYRYAKAFNPEAVKVKHTVDGKEYEMPLMGWYNAMMGNDPDHAFGKGDISDEERVKILAMLESEVLGDYTSSPLTYYASARLISQRIHYQSEDYEYHPLIGFGNTYYDYDDIEWKSYIEESDGFLDYH